jgi:hypothetical protein
MAFDEYCEYKDICFCGCHKSKHDASRLGSPCKGCWGCGCYEDGAAWRKELEEAEMAPERYAILVKPYQCDDFVPVRFPKNIMPEGGYFEWDKAVGVLDRIRHTDPVNEYMIAPVIADPMHNGIV